MDNVVNLDPTFESGLLGAVVEIGEVSGKLKIKEASHFLIQYLANFPSFSLEATKLGDFAHHGERRANSIR